MQAPDQNDKSKQSELEKKVEQQLELSEAWRQLLGLGAPASPLPPAPETARTARTRNQEGVLVLSDDPWHHLLQEQGIQVVDLQRARVHKGQTAGEESDVEHALDMMQENKTEK